jgi:hypothetical protein
MRIVQLVLIATIVTTAAIAEADGLAVTLTRTAGQDVKATPSGFTEPATVVAGSTDFTITCEGDLKCTDVALSIKSTDQSKVTKLTFAPLTPAKGSISLGREHAGVLELSVADKVVFARTITATPAAITKTTDAPPWSQLLAQPCPQPTPPKTAYDRKRDRASVIVSPNGSVLSSISKDFDENDTLEVVVYGDSRLLPLLKVARKSDFRVIGTPNILGRDSKLPTLNRQGEVEASCTTKSFLVGDFAAGKGEVEITADIDGAPVSLGRFELNVNAVYNGMFSLGGAWTPLVDQGFEVAMRGGDNVIVQTETGDRRLVYVFMYTPFIWERLERDVRKGPAKLWHRINPSVGFVVDDPLNNVVLGLTADFRSAVLFTAGMYVSHVRHLEGVAVDDVFDGTTEELPTSRSWETDWFVAVSLDLRVATQLVQAVLGTAD